MIWMKSTHVLLLITENVESESENKYFCVWVYLCGERRESFLSFGILHFFSALKDEWEWSKLFSFFFLIAGIERVKNGHKLPFRKRYTSVNENKTWTVNEGSMRESFWGKVSGNSCI